jgi:8-oxo-dGTP pyrophosphatase MutT (NUDIX family)
MVERLKSCGSVVFKRGNQVEYLLLRGGSLVRPGPWDFSKGEGDTGETETVTALRELKEETGIIDAHQLEGFREQIRYFFRRGGKTIVKTVVFFLFETRQSEVKLSWEHISYEWLVYEKAMERLTFLNSRKVLKKAHDFLARTHASF